MNARPIEHSKQTARSDHRIHWVAGFPGFCLEHGIGLALSPEPCPAVANQSWKKPVRNDLIVRQPDQKCLLTGHRDLFACRMTENVGSLPRRTAMPSGRGAMENCRLVAGRNSESTRPVPKRGAGQPYIASLAGQPVAARKGSASRSVKHAAIAASWTLARVAASIGACLSSIRCGLDNAS